MATGLACVSAGAREACAGAVVLQICSRGQQDPLEWFHDAKKKLAECGNHWGWNRRAGTAIALARAGHAVTVYEKHGAPAPLGAGLLIQPQGVVALEALGVGAAFGAASVPVTRLLGTCHRNWTLVDIAYDGAEARGVSRAALSGLLFDAALGLGVRIRATTSSRWPPTVTPGRKGWPVVPSA